MKPTFSAIMPQVWGLFWPISVRCTISEKTYLSRPTDRCQAVAPGQTERNVPAIPAFPSHPQSLSRSR
jgi:hypothetical protein